MHRNSLVLAASFATAFFGSPAIAATADAYPSRPIRIVIPYPPGGTSDILARLIGTKITESWKQQVIGDNRTGASGNIGLAAHRDSFFRPLKGIRPGAQLYIDTVQSTRGYRVTSISVVSPQDVAVLAETGLPSVTLVTCYPFHYVGAAPQRFIVRAELSH